MNENVASQSSAGSRPTLKFEYAKAPSTFKALLYLVPLMAVSAGVMSHPNKLVGLLGGVLLVVWIGLFIYNFMRRAKEGTHTRYVEVRADGALLPYGFEFKVVRFAQIRDIKVEQTEAGGRIFRVLSIETAIGESRIGMGSLRWPEDFDRLIKALLERWKGLPAPPDKAISAVATTPAVSPPPVRPRVRAAAAAPQSPQEAAMLKAIADQRDKDPLVGARIAGKEITARVMAVLKDGRGVHIESLLCALGALGGYACQAGVRAQAIAANKDPDEFFQVVKTTDGRHYFFGDALNRPLAEDRLSIWSLSAGIAQRMGVQDLPDLNEIFKRVSSEVGGAKFGTVQYPEGHAAGDLPINYLKALWPPLAPMVEMFTGNPKQWAVAFGFAIQEVFTQSKGAIAPALALSIVMQSAIPMSKVTLAEH